MLTIQQVGTEIMSGNPKHFYVMTGSEYGVKQMYIQYLKDHYNEYKESDTVESILSTMTTKHFVPLQPAVYVVRYDEEFLSTLNDKSASRIKNINIIGTIVCLYESPKHCTKVEKYLDDFTVHIDKISSVFIRKYLQRDFPNLPDHCIDAAVESCVDWYEAESMCRCMMLDDMNHLRQTDKKTLKYSFGKVPELDEKFVKPIIASRDFSRLLYLVDKKEGDEDSLIYSVLSTMLDLEKLSSNSNIESELRQYVDRWNLKDIYNMFMQVYNQLKLLRSISADAKNSLLYLITLMQFSEIPSVEEMS